MPHNRLLEWCLGISLAFALPQDIIQENGLLHKPKLENLIDTDVACLKEQGFLEACSSEEWVKRKAR